MTFSSILLDKRRRTYVRLIGEIQNALQKAFAEEAEKRKLTRTAMAEALGRDKSFVTRKLNGKSNMTLETLADFAYALDRAVKVDLVSRHPNAGTNYGPSASPQFPTQTSSAGIFVPANVIQVSPGTSMPTKLSASVV
jgi:transcriptional regulator with XRE-family HTH domain